MEFASLRGGLRQQGMVLFCLLPSTCPVSARRTSGRAWLTYLTPTALHNGGGQYFLLRSDFARRSFSHSQLGGTNARLNYGSPFCRGIIFAGMLYSYNQCGFRLTDLVEPRRNLFSANPYGWARFIFAEGLK